MKFRDEVRPRFGLLRGREFIMKDAYSFHATQESLQEHYDAMAGAYARICERLGLDFRPVEAESGQIGGKVTMEFMALADSGEAELVYCDATGCDYAANVEAASTVVPALAAASRSLGRMEKVHTPDIRTIAELAAFLGIAEHDTVKTMAAIVEDPASADAGRLVFFCVPGDRELNPVKAAVGRARGRGCWRRTSSRRTRCPRARWVRWAPATGGTSSSSATGRCEADVAWGVGANEDDYHFLYAQPGRDFEVDAWADLVAGAAGRRVPRVRRHAAGRARHRGQPGLPARDRATPRRSAPPSPPRTAPSSPSSWAATASA